MSVLGEFDEFMLQQLLGRTALLTVLAEAFTEERLEGLAEDVGLRQSTDSREHRGDGMKCISEKHSE